MQRRPKLSCRDPAAPPGDGSAQSLDHMASWVRFAETKATILTAGLGVVVTLLMTNTKGIVTAISASSHLSSLVAVFAVGSAVGLFYTLGWLLVAIGPSISNPSRINRFAWPTLVNASPHEIREHVQSTDSESDAWDQVMTLSKLANRKFRACSQAVRGFAVFLPISVGCVVLAVVTNL